MRKARLVLVAGLLCLGVTGCSFLSPRSWQNRVVKVADEFHEFRMDIDATIFGLYEGSIEEW